MTPNFKELREEIEENVRNKIHYPVFMASGENLKTILAALDIAERGQWVKCEERMPEAEEDVMIWGPEFYDIGHLSVSEETRFFVYDGYDYKEAQTEITHWMPLPKPPEEK